MSHISFPLDWISKENGTMSIELNKKSEFPTSN